MAFKGIAELDLGEASSAVVNSGFYQSILSETLAIGDFVALLKKEITCELESPSILELIDIRRGISSVLAARLKRIARVGYRMVVILPDTKAGLHFLESQGYEHCAISSLGSIALIHAWEMWLAQHFPDAHGALVFGHDYEPVFIFERVEPPE